MRNIPIYILMFFCGIHTKAASLYYMGEFDDFEIKLLLRDDSTFRISAVSNSPSDDLFGFTMGYGSYSIHSDTINLYDSVWNCDIEFRMLKNNLVTIKGYKPLISKIFYFERTINNKAIGEYATFPEVIKRFNLLKQKALLDCGSNKNNNDSIFIKSGIYKCEWGLHSFANPIEFYVCIFRNNTYQFRVNDIVFNTGEVIKKGHKLYFCDYLSKQYFIGEINSKTGFKVLYFPFMYKEYNYFFIRE